MQLRLRFETVLSVRGRARTNCATGAAPERLRRSPLDLAPGLLQRLRRQRIRGPIPAAKQPRLQLEGVCNPLTLDLQSFAAAFRLYMHRSRRWRS